MVCEKCGSSDVVVSLQPAKTKSKNKGIGLGGHINNAARNVTAMCTFGASNLIWKKSKGTITTKVVNEKICVCQDCGHSWKIK